MNVYFVGSSGCGKTTLAKFVEEQFGLLRLPSAARAIMTLLDLGMDDFPKLMDDEKTYFDFQVKVCKTQMAMEKMHNKEGKAFVSDRAFEHVVYTAHYGTGADKIGDMMTPYIDKLVNHPDRYVMFHVLPSPKILDAAKRQNERSAFLQWNHVVAFDGVVKFILEMCGIPHETISTDDLAARKEFVYETLIEAGFKEKK